VLDELINQVVVLFDGRIEIKPLSGSSTTKVCPES
jgi:hypothetical protein